MTYLRNIIAGGQNKGQSYNNVPFYALPPNLILKTASEEASKLLVKGHVTEVNLKGLPRGPCRDNGSCLAGSVMRVCLKFVLKIYFEE